MILQSNFIRLASVSLLIAGFAQMASSQAILPASWDFDAAIPTGWTESLGTGNTRYANGQVGQACRLDNTGEYVLIQFAEEPGALTYYIKGQNSGGAWQGTFTVQQSVTGVTWTTLRTFSNADMPTGAYTQYTDNPGATSRFIRFNFTNKISGQNVALDEVALAVPAFTNAQEINVAQAGNNIPSGFTYSIGNNVSTDFTIQNLGLVSTLTISSIDLSGPDAGEFSLTGIPTSVAAQNAQIFNLQFSNAGGGSRFCTITINSNDVSEGQYIINVYAVAGSLATEPTAQAGDLSFTNVVTWDFNVGFSAGNPASERYLVLRRKGSAVSDEPVDGSTYVKGDYIGSSQVVYLGDAASFNARSVEASTGYYFAVFAVNGPAGYENYLTDSPLTGSVTTPGPSIGSYYSGVDHNDPDFVDQVTEALNPSNYFQIFYSNYISTLINSFYVKDTSIEGVSLNAIECQYSGNHYTYNAAFQWWDGSGNGALSREHSYPQSWMPTYFEAGFDDRPEVSDLHNLFPVLQEECNAVRSNYPYGEVESPSYTFGETSFGDNEFSQEVYEPRNEFKGEVARAVMYQAAKYNSTEFDFSLPEQISLIVPYGQNEYLLKSWHFNDLPNGSEIARNEYIKSQQNNRNAFIDSVLFPCFIRFSNLTKWEPLFTVGGNELTAIDPGLSYQWYLDGEAIDGADSPTYTVTENGNYSLEVQQFAACPVIRSQDVNVTLASTEELNATASSVAVFPNPSEGQLNVRVYSPRGGMVNVRITDMTGKVAHLTTWSMEPGDRTFDLDPELPAGIYLTEITLGEIRHNLRLVIR